MVFRVTVLAFDVYGFKLQVSWNTARTLAPGRPTCQLRKCNLEVLNGKFRKTNSSLEMQVWKCKFGNVSVEMSFRKFNAV